MSDEWADPNRPAGAGDSPSQPSQPDVPPVTPAPPAGYGPPHAAPAPPYGTPPYGTPPYGTPSYGAPSPWASPAYPGQGPAYGEPPASARHGRARTTLIVSAAIVIVVVLGIASIVLDAHHSSSKDAKASVGTAASSSAAPTPAPGSSTAPGIPSGSNPPLAPGTSGGAGTTTGPYDSYLLSPAEAGATGMDLIDGGRAIDTADPTLDWCGRTYPSDQLRTGRVQVEYEGSDDFVSNEFVRYSTGGTAKAYAEIQAAVQSCQPSFQDSSGETDQITVAAHSSSLVGDQITVSAFENGAVPFWTAVVYQFDGSYFSGVYVSGSSRTSVLQVADALGAKAATHLRQAAAGTAGSGGGVVSSPPPDSSPAAGGGAQT